MATYEDDISITCFCRPVVIILHSMSTLYVMYLDKSDLKLKLSMYHQQVEFKVFNLAYCTKQKRYVVYCARHVLVSKFSIACFCQELAKLDDA